MQIRGADGRLYEMTEDGAQVVSMQSPQDTPRRTVVAQGNADSASGANWFEPPFPPSFP